MICAEETDKTCVEDSGKGGPRMAEGDRFRGIYPMLYALFGPAGALDREAMRAQVLRARAR